MIIYGPIYRSSRRRRESRKENSNTLKELNKPEESEIIKKTNIRTNILAKNIFSLLTFVSTFLLFSYALYDYDKNCTKSSKNLVLFKGMSNIEIFNDYVEKYTTYCGGESYPKVILDDVLGNKRLEKIVIADPTRGRLVGSSRLWIEGIKSSDKIVYLEIDGESVKYYPFKSESEDSLLDKYK